jgi:hypothetical protein
VTTFYTYPEPTPTTTNDVNNTLHTLRSLTVRRNYYWDPLRKNLSYAIAVSATPAADSQFDFDRESLYRQIF